MAPNIIKNSLAALSNGSYLHTEDLKNKSEHGSDDILSKSTDSSLFPNNDGMVLPASNKSLRTFNPIRAIVDPILRQSSKENPDCKQQISLALGDPTAHGNFTPCPAIINAMTEALQSPSAAAGYVNACGTDKARESIADHYGVISPDQVIVANGCSGALELALTSLLDDDTYLLVPCPAFPLYEVIVKSHGANIAHYNLLHDKGWECDLNHLEQVICELLKNNNKNIRCPIRGIMINNPGNPTGSVFSVQHMIDLLQLSQKYHIPIISDEIYGNLTFGDAQFQSIIQVASKYQLYTPLIVVSGIGKQFLVPGWRVGWIVFYDEGTNESLKEIEEGAKRLAQVILGASHLAQCAIPAALKKDDNDGTIISWQQSVRGQLEEQAILISKNIHSCNGLSLVTKPQGAMYCMVRIHIEDFDPLIKDDVSFVQLLLKEENVLVLPGQAFFGTSNNKQYFFRIVFCAPKETLTIAMNRLMQFCQRHCKTATSSQEEVRD